MKKCPSCGTYVDDVQKFCSYCGAPLDLERTAENANAGVPDPEAASDVTEAAPEIPVPEIPVPDPFTPGTSPQEDLQDAYQQIPPVPDYQQQTTQQGVYQQVPPVPDYQQTVPQQNTYQQVPPVPPTGNYRQTNSFSGAPGGSGESKGLAIASLICGIGSIPLGFFTGIFGIVLGAVALVLGIVALKKNQTRGFSIGGLVTGVIGAVIGVIMFVIALLVIRTATQTLGGMQSLYEGILGGSGSEYSSPEQIVPEISSIMESIEEELGITESSEAESTGASESTAGGSGSEASGSGQTSGAALSVGEMLLVDQDGIRVVAGELDYDDWGDPYVNVSIENNTAAKVTVTTEAVCVNGYVVDGWLYEQVTPGNRVSSELMLTKSGLAAIGIEKIGAIDTVINAYDAETYEDIFMVTAPTIKTSLYDERDIPDRSEGVEIANQDGVRIVMQQQIITDDYDNAGIGVYIENNSDLTVYVYHKDTALNGVMIDGYGSWTIPAGMKAFGYVTFYEEDLEASGIDGVSGITNGEINFRVIDSEYYDTLYETGTVTFSLQ